MATVYIRNLPHDVHARFARNARIRGLTQGQYLERLVALHRAVMAGACDADALCGPSFGEALDAEGLGPVSD